MTIDTMGNFYLSGSFSGTVDLDPGTATDNRSTLGSWDVFLVKLNADGSYSWARAMGGNGSDNANSIAVDAYGHAYVAGNFSQSVDFDSGGGVDARASLGETDIFVTKISHCGMPRAEGCP